MKSRSQIASGVVLSYIAQAFQVIIALFYTPIVLRMLGQSEYGIYQIAYSVVSYLTLFSFGFSSSYVKFYSTCLCKENSEEEIKKLNGIYLTIFAILGMIVLIVGSIMAYHTSAILGGKLTQTELETSKKLMWILVFSSAINFPTIVFSNHIIAKEKFLVLQIINIVTIILNPLLTFPLMVSGFKSIALAIIMLLISIVKFVVSVLYCITRLKMRFLFETTTVKEIKDIGTFSFFIFLESVIYMINVSLDRVLLGKMVGSIAVAIYAVGGQMNTLYTSLGLSVSSVFTPRINRIVAENNDNEMLSVVFRKVGKLQYGILLIVLLGFFFFGRRFMLIWGGASYENAYYVALVLMIPNTINLIQNIAIEIQRAKGLQKYRSSMYSVIAAMNIIISLLLIKRYNEVGAAMGTGIAWIIGGGIIMNVYYAKKVGLNVKEFWKDIIYMSRGAIPCIIYGMIIHNSTIRINIELYILYIVGMILLYLISMWHLGLKNDEREIIISFLKRFLVLRKIG